MSSSAEADALWESGAAEPGAAEGEQDDIDDLVEELARGATLNPNSYCKIQRFRELKPHLRVFFSPPTLY